MAVNEVIQALEYCAHHNSTCRDCPYARKFSAPNCEKQLHIDALKCIKRQQTEIELLSVQDEPIKIVMPEGVDEKRLAEMIRNAPIQIFPCEPVQEWISVKERLPDEVGQPVLVAATNCYDQTRIVKAFLDYDAYGFFRTNEKEYDGIWSAWEVTHWMPMPEPPKGE